MESQRQETLLFHKVETAIAAKKRANGVTDIYDFQRKAPGYLQCAVSDWQPSDHGNFEVTTWDSKRCSMLKGYYVGSYAHFLLRDHFNLITGFLMDTAWRIFYLDVASILTVVVANAGTAIALSFDLTEDGSLYDTF